MLACIFYRESNAPDAFRVMLLTHWMAKGILYPISPWMLRHPFRTPEAMSCPMAQQRLT